MSGPRRRSCRRPPPVMGDNSNGYVEIDPTGRYGRFEELLGKGAMKSVYRGFDEERGVEVAWNQASLADVLRTPDAVQRVYSEVQLLSKLRHDAIMGFQASWVDVPRRTFNFITELFSSGTLRSYRLRYPRVALRAVRSWARQILRGLAYLHGHRPPVIHRDLKCDNLFVHGHQGQVKIGDLGLAAVLREAGQPARSVVGTPEFMAPEMYDEEYDELVDVYAFGMCMLEMLTTEYPYAECSNPAQIYKKVTAGKLPDAFYRIDDDEARRFVGRCLVAADQRPSAAELLLDPFLLVDDHAIATSPRATAVMPPLPELEAAAPPSTTCSSSSTVISSTTSYEDDGDHEPPAEAPSMTDMAITGKLNSDGDTIFLKVQIADETGQVRNIYFPFDVAGDTATEVATEMVKELEITDRDASEIAAMIDQEVARLVPAAGTDQQHDEYTYAHDDDDNENPNPFYYLFSSPTSSQGSHCGAGPHTFSGPRGSGRSEDDCDCDGSSDDEIISSQLHHPSDYLCDNYNHSRRHHKDDEKPQVQGGGQHNCCSKATSRFCPPAGGDEGSSSSSTSHTRSAHLLPHHLHAGRPRRRDDGRRGRMARNRSMVDMRSQLLHRTLVEELNRRLFFNTVGAVEDIGFRMPHYSTSPSTRARGTGRSKDDQHRYYMF